MAAKTHIHDTEEDTKLKFITPAVQAAMDMVREHTAPSTAVAGRDCP